MGEDPEDLRTNCSRCCIYAGLRKVRLMTASSGIARENGVRTMVPRVKKT